MLKLISVLVLLAVVGTPTPLTFNVHDPVPAVPDTYGNIRQVPGQVWVGQIPHDGPFVMFSSREAGARAIKKLLETYASLGVTTVREVITRYAPPHENPTDSYIDFVSDFAEISSSTDVINSGRLDVVVEAILIFEGYNE